MSTALVFGNGNMLINVDERMQISDLYWPHVGKNNHLTGHHIRMYFWDYGNFVDIADPNSFTIIPQYVIQSLSGQSIVESEKYGVRIVIENTVLPHRDIYLAKFTITNLWDMDRSVKFFINHDFYIKEHNIGDTACWYPMSDMLFHYKDNTYLGIGSIQGIDQYSCGRSHSYDGEGTLPDVSTGMLNSYAIDHGAVESTVGFDVALKANGISTFDYFISCGRNFEEGCRDKNYISTQGVDHLILDASNFWRSSLTTSLEHEPSHDWSDLSEVFAEESDIQKAQDIFVRSIGTIKTQIDNSGAVIAGNDSTHIKYLKDSYSYMWHRDGALVISALDELGYMSLSQKFFKLSATLLEPGGYFAHKYTSSGTRGASWHAWVDSQGNPQLPIQEDETATVLWALWKHYEQHGNHELISELWETLIKPAANFLCAFRFAPTSNIDIPHNLRDFLDIIKQREYQSGYPAENGLPMNSYDIWEEQYGIHLYTCCSVYGGLVGASILALKLGQHDEAEQYATIASEIKKATLRYLYDEDAKHFVHAIYKNSNQYGIEKSSRVDASICGIWIFDMLPTDDYRVVSTMKWLEGELWNPGSVGGVLRYCDDDYYRKDKSTIGNPWYITTLWLAQYYIRQNDMQKASIFLKWVVDNTHGTYLMSEQLDCKTGEEVSIKPLTWSHAEFIRTINLLLNN